MTNYECENRISDDEIISSLEVIATTRNCSECKIRNCTWGYCNCSQITANAALDLINRQKAEIEQWKEEANKYQKLWCIAVADMETAKSEAIQEFAEGLKEKKQEVFTAVNDSSYAVTVYNIDNLLKEVVGED